MSPRRLLISVAIVLVVGIGGLVAWRFSQPPLRHALSAAPPNGVWLDATLWYPAEIEHPCERCGRCVHKLEVLESRAEFMEVRRERTLLGYRRVTYYFDSAEHWAQAGEDPWLTGGKTAWRLHARYLSPHTDHECGGGNVIVEFTHDHYVAIEFAVSGGEVNEEEPMPLLFTSSVNGAKTTRLLKRGDPVEPMHELTKSDGYREVRVTEVWGIWPGGDVKRGCNCGRH